METPTEVKNVLSEIKKAGHEAYIVGGCVRDLLMNKSPKDWDVTTSATPEEIQKIFPDSFYENEFGTVGVKTESEDPTLHVIEVTTYRLESKYSNKRHPDAVSFTKNLEEDLKRRDFTMNAVALNEDGIFQDPYNGQDDIDAALIRAVGDPDERFSEDALRMMRAIRFVATLSFDIEEKTYASIAKNSKHLKEISQERIHDELVKLLLGKDAYKAVELLKDTGLLQYILPELLEGVGVGQNHHHVYTVWEHNIKSLGYAVDQNYSLEVRLGSLLHDVGKPQTKRGKDGDCTFYGHDVVGERIVRKALSRLKFSKDQIDKISQLVRWHMFYYNVDEVTESSVRRLVAHIGLENVEDLIKVREADRIGSGVPKAKPYKIRHLQFMIDKVSRDPVSPKMLKLKGDELMKLLKIEPGPKVGMIIHALMEEVLDDPTLNTLEHLSNRAKEFAVMTDEDLLELKKKGQKKIASAEKEEVDKIKQKHYVQ